VKRGIIAVACLLCILAALLFLRPSLKDPGPATPARPPEPAAAAHDPAPAMAGRVTDPPVILPVTSEAARLNTAGQTAMDDIATLQVLLGEYRRHLGGNPVGDNDEITAALLGRNPKRLACLPATGGPFLDTGGRLIDRWGTPYFFHALSGSEMQIISAGQDRTLYTADDIRSGE